MGEQQPGRPGLLEEVSAGRHNLGSRGWMLVAGSLPPLNSVRVPVDRMALPVSRVDPPFFGQP